MKFLAKLMRSLADKIDPRPDFPPPPTLWDSVSMFETTPNGTVQTDGKSSADCAARGRSYADEVEKVRQEQLNDKGSEQAKWCCDACGALLGIECHDDRCEHNQGFGHINTNRPPISNIEPVSLKRPGIKKRKLASVPDSDPPRAA